MGQEGSSEQLSSLEAIEVEMINTLKTLDIEVDKYFGELIDPKKFKAELSSMPLVLVDFIGSSPENSFNEEAKFNLYEIHISYAKNEKTRAKKHYELYELQKSIKDCLFLKSFKNSEPMKMGKLQKIYDSSVTNGYLTVFKQEVSVIYKEGVEI